MNNDNLPAELLDEVFTLLTPPLDDSAAHDLSEPISKSDLVACALTCRAWCVRARPYMFHSLAFSFRNTVRGTQSLANYTKLLAVHRITGKKVVDVSQ